MQLLKNLFKVGSGKKNVDITCYTLTSSLYLQRENIKIQKIDENM